MTGLSVVIPCFNAAPYIAQTLSSVLRQTRQPDEIVVADDGSTDGSQDIVERYPGVRRIDGPFGGAGPARMAGLEKTSGEAVMFLDADDLLRFDTLEHLGAALPAGGMSRCYWQRYEKEGAAWVARPPSCVPRAPWQDDLSAWLTGWYCPPCALLWSRGAVETAGGWTKEGVSNDDGDLVMRALTAGAPMREAKGGTAYYRRLPGESQTLSGRRFSKEALEGRLFVIARVEERLTAAARRARYDAALAEAYRHIEEDAGEETELFEKARARRLAIEPKGAAEILRPLRTRTGYAATRFPAPALTRRPPARPLPWPAARSPLVSVIIPTYNRPEKTARAVASVLAQSHAALELIVVDDASAQGPPTLPDDPRVKLVRQETNKGVAAARNRGLAEAKGGLFAFLDSDDQWRRDKLEKQLDVLDAAGRRCGLVYSGYEEHSDFEARTVANPQGEGDVFAELLRANSLYSAGSSMLITAEAFETIGGFDETLPAAEDWDFILRVARFFEVASANEPLVLIDTSPDPDRRSRQLAANLDAREMIYERYKDDLRRASAERAFLMESARRALAESGADPRRGRRDVLRALTTWPPDPALLPWLPYMMAPSGLRAALRRLDGRASPRPVR